MGRDAGVTTVAVLSGIGSREDLKEADHIIQRYKFNLAGIWFFIIPDDYNLQLDYFCERTKLFDVTVSW